jgi:Methylase of polypeptide chain release factors
VHRPSVTLASLTVRRDVASALDVGTGCGVQALLAAKHAERVVATDINERALAFADSAQC